MIVSPRCWLSFIGSLLVFQSIYSNSAWVLSISTFIVLFYVYIFYWPDLKTIAEQLWRRMKTCPSGSFLTTPYDSHVWGMLPEVSAFCLLISDLPAELLLCFSVLWFFVQSLSGSPQLWKWPARTEWHKLMILWCHCEGWDGVCFTSSCFNTGLSMAPAKASIIWDLVSIKSVCRSCNSVWDRQKIIIKTWQSLKNSTSPAQAGVDVTFLN